MYINHLTLATGHMTRIHRGDVAGETLARVAPWLEAAVQSGQALPLPVRDVAEYQARAVMQDGCLLLTVSSPVGQTLATLAVAKRSRHGATIWPLLGASHMPPMLAGLQRPQEPWCAVALWPCLALDPDATGWLGDFERCVAWAWCTRHEDDA